jgi:hypothetical protein
MKMLKRTLIALAVVALLAGSVQALGPEPHRGNGAIKINKAQGMKVYWPFEYKALDLCTIDVLMEIGYYVAMEKCGHNDSRIILQQVECGDIGKGGGDWPCYKDCVNLKIHNNFPVKLGLNKSRVGGVITHNNHWKAYIEGDVSVLDPGNTTISLCVEAWKVNLAASDAVAGETKKVGEVTITVKPDA